MPAETANQKTGGYLTYSPDSMGTLFLHWSEQEVGDALAFFESGKKIPPFKFKTNHGKQILAKGVDDKQKFYQGWGSFLKEGLVRYQAKDLQVKEKGAAREDIQVALRSKSDGKVVRVKSGENWAGDSGSLAAFSVVNESNMSFNVGTLEHSVFMSKAKLEGCGHEM